MLQAATFLPPRHGAPVSIGVAASMPARLARLLRAASFPSSKDHCCKSLAEDGLHRTLTKQTERIQLVRQNREQATQTLCFNSRPFVLCGLPVRRLPNDSCCTNAGTDVLFCRSPVIPTSVFRSGRTGSCPSFSQPWPS